MFKRAIVPVSRALRLALVPHTPLAVRQVALARPLVLSAVRWNSSQSGSTAQFQGEKPQLMIAFTCKKCNTRSSHTFSKQAYQTGLVLIQCPGCQGRHLIADNLKIFSDNNFDLEKYLADSGQSVGGVDTLVFEDIPKDLRGTLGRYAQDAPEEYREKEDVDRSLPEAEKKK